MKAFLEEYGLVIVIVIVVAMLILVAALTSSNGKGRLFQTFNAFTKKGTDSVEAGLDMEPGDLADEQYMGTPAYYNEGSSLDDATGTLTGGTWSDKADTETSGGGTTE